MWGMPRLRNLCLKFVQEVVFEFLISTIARTMLELITVDLKAERSLARGRAWRGDVNTKHGSFLWQRLDLVLLGDNLEGEARVLDDDAPDADAARAAAARDLDLGAVEVGRGQLRSCTLAPVVELAAQDLARVAEPEVVQGREDGVLPPLLGQAVELEAAPLAGGQRPRLQGPGALLLLVAGPASGFARGRGQRGARLQEERSMLDLV